MARAAFAETSFLDSAGAVTSPAAEAAGGREVSSSGVMLAAGWAAVSRVGRARGGSAVQDIVWGVGDCVAINGRVVSPVNCVSV